MRCTQPLRRSTRRFRAGHRIDVDDGPQLRWLPTTPGFVFATASGGIGWGVPAAVGVALGDRARGVERTVVATIGDGSFQYSCRRLDCRPTRSAGRFRRDA